ncbi:methyl-accepting chemotaxis protein [Marinospirillum perlucidum]|uniref:methyl-accepting chemotaxis protein n=1 Tax=Marinospirillum perlucidum TaxID=1982602 RepID=UPI000DF11CAB|nr:methyl-accepting chemotaxis protein [Marinospirillum perlucidum]
MLSSLRNLSIRYKLMLLVIPPLVGMLVYASLSTRNDLLLFSKLEEQQQLAQTREELNSVFSLYKQTRRNWMQGNSLNNQLTPALQQLQALARELPLDNQDFWPQLLDWSHQLDQQEASLERLLDPDAPLNRINHQLEVFSTQLAGLADGMTTRWHSAHHALMLATARLNEEEVLMQQAFAAGYFPQGAYPRFIRLLSEQQVFFNTYNNHLQAYPQLQLTSWRQSETYQEVARLRQGWEQIYLDGNFGLSAPRSGWPQLSQKLAERPQRLQEQVLTRLQERVNQELGAAYQRLLWVSLSNIALVLLGASIAWFIYRQISRPTLQLTRSMEGVAQDLDLTRQLSLQGQDETAQAARAFDQMLTQVRQLLTDVIQATDRVATSSHLGKRVASNLEDQVTQGQANLEAVLGQVDQLHAAIHEIAQNASTSQEASEEASQLAARGGQLVTRLQEQNQSLETSLRASGDKVEELAEHSEKISNILEVINDIAEQTNLLALNAAIEAARAGDAGRGFAVVADEVRSLAGRSREATVEISQLLESNRLAAQDAVGRMQASLSQADEVSQQLHQAGESLGSINTAVQAIHSRNAETAAAATQQRNTADQLKATAEQTDELYQATRKEVEELEHNSSSLEELLEGLNRQLGRFTT